LLASIILLELKQHRGLTNTGINVALFLRHLLGIDIENNIGPLGRRLLGQVVNVAGLGLLCALLAALFRPHTAPARYPTDLERDEVTNLLDKYGLSSEDFFKLWPQPKRYFWDGARTTVIAYEVKRSVAFVLGNPVGPDAEGQERVINDFVSYCRSHGWRACFILIQEAQKEAYHSSDLKLFRIGATAFVDIEQFADKTSRNKWWRWVLNKTARQNLHYELAAPPHSAELLNKVKSVSDAWIKRSGHSERGFAMGYFDQNYLQACRLHLLKQADEVVAFANELPGFHNNPTVTIDLMRYQPSVNHAMPTLLADIIQQLHSENSKQYFDLGFVPLAGDSSKSEQVIKKLNQFFIRETIPASGLEQFKNKFDPEWENTYVAFDGDWLDLVHVSRWLDKLLRPPKAGL
jgi:phosphatidylglycerol lysyltransferase